MDTTRKTLLEQLFAGNLSPSEHARPQDPEYPITCDEAEKEYLYMRNLLNEEDKKHFERLLDLNLRMACMNSSACFTSGFQYGALLMLELMDARDALLSCP